MLQDLKQNSAAPQNPTGISNIDLWNVVFRGEFPFQRVSWSRGGELEESTMFLGKREAWVHSRSCSCPQDVLTLSSSTDSEGEHRAGHAPGTANDSDDIQTISSGSDEEEGEDKKNQSSGSGEGGDEG